MLHGWGGNKNSILPLANVLSSEYTVTAVDFYGFGDTPHPAHPINLDDYVDGVFQLVKKYYIDKVTLVGHSFGGKVAMRFALRYPTFVKSLVLLDASGMRPRRGFVFYAKKAINKVCILLNKQPPFMSFDYSQTNGAMRRTFVSVVNNHLDKQIGAIRARTLIIWGKRDKDTPLYMAKRINKSIRGSKLQIIRGGHFAYLNNIAITGAIIKRFLGEE